MADETIVNGVASEAVDRTVVEITGKEDRDELFVDFDDIDRKVSDLNQKIAALEQEKAQLVHENEVIRERIKKLTEEIDGLNNDKAEMKREIEQSEADKKALESIAARAAELEMEVSRLQHDLISSMTEGEELNAELVNLKSVVEGLKKSDSEKGSKVEVLEKERNLLLERMDKEAEQVRESKAESENQIRELEKKIEALEARESIQNSERIKVEGESKAIIDKKDSEIRRLKKCIESLDSVVLKNNVEIERLRKGRGELDIVKNDMEAVLKKSERNVKETEDKMGQLHRELEASEQMISGLKEKAAEVVNGEALVMDRVISEDGEKGLMGLKLQWPVVAASAGAIAAVAVVCYLRYGSRR